MVGNVFLGTTPIDGYVSLLSQSLLSVGDTPPVMLMMADWPVIPPKKDAQSQGNAW